MNRTVRHGLLVFAVALLGFWAVSGNGVVLRAAGEEAAVQGQLMQLYNNGSRTFTTVDANRISGLSYPVSLICPGTLDLLSTFSGQPACTEPSGNGMRGWVVTREQVVRDYSDAANPIFTMDALLGFSGSVFINGQEYFGTLQMKLTASGPLNQPAGVDCQATPDNLFCGAASFTGTWEILADEGTGELEPVRGSGNAAWTGCTDPDNFATCAVPTYDGTLYLAYDVYLPLTAR